MLAGGGHQPSHRVSEVPWGTLEQAGTQCTGPVPLWMGGQAGQGMGGPRGAGKEAVTASRRETPQCESPVIRLPSQPVCSPSSLIRLVSAWLKTRPCSGSAAHRRTALCSRVPTGLCPPFQPRSLAAPCPTFLRLHFPQILAQRSQTEDRKATCGQQS